ncbi:MAG TPA: methyl-accepting chemotaxis protein, partial [Myxococcales bacterium]
VLKDSQAAVEASQQGEQGAARVVDLARQAGSAIASLATAIQDSAKVAQMIARSSHEQTQGVDQIVEAIRQSSKAIDDALDGSRRIENVARKLAELSEGLSTVAKGSRPA